MAEEKVQAKTYIRGSFLYSEDGLNYQERQRQTEQKIIQDKTGMLLVQKEFRDKKNAHIQKRKMANGTHKVIQKTVLIPIRDTPVQPVPEPVLENQKCQRATQQQFEYFQTYISQRQKERQLEEEEQRKVQDFLQCQEREREKEKVGGQNVGTSLIMVKYEDEVKKSKANKKCIKIMVKKKSQGNNQKTTNKDQANQDYLTKVRILN